MNALRRLLACLAALCLGAAAIAAETVDFALLRSRVAADLAVGVDWPRAVRRAEAHAAAMTPQGAWPDVDYANRHITVWAPRKHLERLRDIALVFGAEASGKARDPDLRDALLRGLTHWQQAHPRSKNWWFNQIFTPRLLGETLILAQAGGVGVDDLPPGLLDRWAKEGGDPSKKAFNTTGSNRMALGEHWAYRGILTADAPAFEVFARRVRLDPAAPPPAAQSTVYPRSDYALHVRPAFTFDVRANSARTARCEWGNDENLLGHYLSEGSTGFVARGDEYAEIAPLWDWFKVPGTTVVDKGRDKAIPRGKPWGRLGSATFVGGVDGVGALAFAYRRDAEAPGRFAWFALGDAAGRVAVVAHTAGDFSFGGCTLATERPCVALFTKEGGLAFVDPATGRDDFRCVLTCP